MVNNEKFQLETLTTANVSTTIENAIKSAISSAQANINWATGRKVEIESYFDITTTEAPVTDPFTLCSTTTSEITTRSPTTSAGETTSLSTPTPTGETTSTTEGRPTTESGPTTDGRSTTERGPTTTPTPLTTTEKGSAEMTKSVTLLPVILLVLLSVMLFT